MEQMNVTGRARTLSAPAVAAIVKDARTIKPKPRPDWYRVQLNTVVRKGKDLDSERIRILPMGTRVRVLEICSRRVRIDKPVPGWCSMKSAGGDIILKIMDDDDEDLSTPRFGSNASKKAKMLREKICKVQEQQRMAKLKMGKAQACPEIRALTDRHSKLTKIIRNKVAPPQSPRSMKAKLLHTQSCMSHLELENSVKKSELIDLQNQLGDVRAQITSVCRKQGVDNPLELTAQIERMENDQEAAREKIQEYQLVTRRYERELVSMKEQMSDLLNKEQPFERQNSYRIQNEEIHSGDVVMMKGDIGIVIVHFIGQVHWNKDEVFVGVELGDTHGDSNGSVDGHTYFSVGPNRGAFFPISTVERKIPAASLLKQLQKQVELNNRLIYAKE